MSYFLRLVQNEWMKTTSKRQTTFYLAFLALMIAGMGLLMRFVMFNDATELSPFDFIQMMSMVSMLITFYFLIVISAQSFTDEYKDGTIKQLLIRPASRNMILSSKIVNLILITIVISVFIFIISALAGFLLFRGENTGTIGSTVGMLLAMLPELSFYGLFAIMLAVVTRSIGLAISIPIILQTVIAGLLRSFSDKAWYKLIIFPNMDWSPYFTEGANPPYLGATLGFSVLIYCIYMIILLLITMWSFNTRDIQ